MQQNPPILHDSVSTADNCAELLRRGNEGLQHQAERPRLVRSDRGSGPAAMGAGLEEGISHHACRSFGSTRAQASLDVNHAGRDSRGFGTAHVAEHRARLFG